MGETTSIGAPPPATDATAGGPNAAAWEAEVAQTQTMIETGVLLLGGTVMQMMASTKAIGDEAAQD